MSETTDEESAVLYRIGTVSRIVGIPAETLRNWERRFGLLKPTRGRGGQRLYGQEAIARLRKVQRLLSEGLSIGEIAQQADVLLVDSGTEASVSPLEAAEAPAKASESPRAAPSEDAAPYLDAAVAAALAFRPAGIYQAFDDAMKVMPTEQVLSDVVLGASGRLGALWQSGQCGVANEQIASACFSARIHCLLESNFEAHDKDQGPLAVTACLPGELHELGILVAGYLLTTHGCKVLHLGSNLPVEELEYALRRVTPRWAFLSVTRRANFESHRPYLIEFGQRWKSRTQLWIGGRGAPANDESLASAGISIAPANHSMQEILRGIVTQSSG